MATATLILPNGDALASPSQDIISALSTSPHIFLQPTDALHAAAIVAAKRFLDPLAQSVSVTQEQRRQETRRKRKRSIYDDGSSQQVLQLKQVYTNGFNVGQIWEQAKRISEAAQAEVSRGLQEVHDLKGANITNGMAQAKQDRKKAVRFEKADDDDLGEDNQAFDNDDDSEGYIMDEEELQDVPEDGTEHVVDDDQPNEDIEVSDENEDEMSAGEPEETFIPDPNGLNDGFFSIDQFNRQSQFLEQQDARGDPDDSVASDEDEVDWDADPLAMGDQPTADEDAGSEEHGSQEDGPTFGNVDLDAPSDEDDEGMEAEDLGDIPTFDNTNDIMYTNFFDPPPQKLSKTKRMRALPKTQPSSKPSHDNDLESDIQRAVSDVRRDLFDEDELSEDSDPDPDNATDGPRKVNLSTHEKQRAKIQAEIRLLETAAVSKRDWALSGEARAIDRPLNSVLEEDLEFERVGKPVPVITNAVSEEIESLIKRRILAREFDEVIRRRPETASSSRLDIRRGRVEVDDSKPSAGLAEIYEDEHLRSTDPNYTSTLDQRTKKEHAELTKMWKEISSQLDLLSNWNYKPKLPETNITVVTDAPTISMEDIRPGIASGISGTQSAIAPQEIYTPGQEGKITAGEVTLKSGVSVAKGEMTKEEKIRRRRREKERNKKKLVNKRADDSRTSTTSTSTGGEAGKRRKSKGEDRRDIISELKKGGVTVIGKKGDLADVEGKKAKDMGKGGGLVSSVGAFKL